MHTALPRHHRTHNLRRNAAMLGILLAMVAALIPATAPSAEARKGRAASVKVRALPPIAKAGPRATAAPKGGIVTADFAPAQRGRPVLLQRKITKGKKKGKWARVSRKTQDATGQMVFKVNGSRYTYRVVSPAYGGYRKVVSKPVKMKKWSKKLDFSDGFGGRKLNKKHWTHDKRSHMPGIRTCARPTKADTTVRGGAVIMGVSRNPKRRDTCRITVNGKRQALPYLRNTQFSTAGKYSFKYGYAAARVKVQRSRGMHSAFWMNPLHGMQPKGKGKGSEIDVMEYFGQRSSGREQGIGTKLHRATKSGQWRSAGSTFAHTSVLKGPQQFWDNYHVYSVEWTPKRYIFRLDGREYYRTSRYVAKAPEYIILSMLTSDWEVPALFKPGNTLNDTAKVDWVRVWER